MELSISSEALQPFRRVRAAVTTPPLGDLLAAWRAAERRWEEPASADEVRAAALEVISAWTAYQDAALAATPNEFLLVADDEGVYVTATAGIEGCLGYRRDTVIGMTIADLAAPDLRKITPAEWAAFLAAGRQDGRFQLRAADGRIVDLRYQARAHHPIPGYHMSRLWSERADDASDGSFRTAQRPDFGGSAGLE